MRASCPHPLSEGEKLLAAGRQLHDQVGDVVKVGHARQHLGFELILEGLVLQDALSDLAGLGLARLRVSGLLASCSGVVGFGVAPAATR